MEPPFSNKKSQATILWATQLSLKDNGHSGPTQNAFVLSKQNLKPHSLIEMGVFDSVHDTLQKGYRLAFLL
jgi:hypothetical protein